MKGLAEEASSTTFSANEILIASSTKSSSIWSDKANFRGTRNPTDEMNAEVNPENWEGTPLFKRPDDTRARSCKKTWYSHDFGEESRLSIIIPYLKESFQHVMGTLQSVIDSTPMELVDEILMIDDGNPPEYQYKKSIEGLHEKIRVFTNPQREGLIRSKSIGVQQVSSPIIFFFEPHCILQKDWLQPLLAHVKGHENRIVQPVIGIIPEKQWDTYADVGVGQTGTINKLLAFNWGKTPTERLKEYEEGQPFHTPFTSGGILLMHRKRFLEYGGYDTQMLEWGGEHIEFSLRHWMCGSELYIVPCSRLGHVFRAANPYSVDIAKVHNNTARASIWTDFGQAVLMQKDPHTKLMERGDVSDRIQLRFDHKCRDFQWFIHNVFPEYVTEK